MQRKDGLPKQPPSGERVCIQCSRPFMFTSNVQKRCPVCQKILLDEKAHTLPCPVCALPFVAVFIKGTKVRRKTCSKMCANTLNASKSHVNRNYGEKKCEVCEKLFTVKATNQRHCTKECRSKAEYARNIGMHRERDKRKISKQRIGLNIRDEHLKTPTQDAKWLWDGIGRWSQKYWPDIQVCLECNTSVYRHNSNGVCEKCYDKLRPRNDEEVKEWKKRSYERLKAAGHSFSRKQSNEWIERAKNGVIPVTPTINNLLDNLTNLTTKV